MQQKVRKKMNSGRLFGLKCERVIKLAMKKMKEVGMQKYSVEEILWLNAIHHFGYFTLKRLHAVGD